MVRCYGVAKVASNRLLLLRNSQRTAFPRRVLVAFADARLLSLGRMESVSPSVYLDAESLPRDRQRLPPFRACSLGGCRGRQGATRGSEKLVGEIPLSWDRVYTFVKRIPRGRVTTYGEVAKALRLPGGARAVGYAMSACPQGQGIPWQRVIAAGGRISIPEPHGSLQRRLLAAEGVDTSPSRIDLERYSWTVPKRKPRPKKARIASPRA
jgi:methylated-DNA-protein-cysteine methyltransferase related protein